MLSARESFACSIPLPRGSPRGVIGNYSQIAAQVYSLVPPEVTPVKRFGRRPEKLPTWKMATGQQTPCVTALCLLPACVIIRLGLKLTHQPTVGSVQFESSNHAFVNTWRLIAGNLFAAAQLPDDRGFGSSWSGQH